MNINIFDDGPNLKVAVTGSLSQLPASTGPGVCGSNGFLLGQFQTINPSFQGLLCSGPAVNHSLYSITGPAGYGGDKASNATSVSGSPVWFATSAFTSDPQFASKIGLDPSYTLNTPYFSEAIFAGKSLASEGFTATGLVGTWTINGTSESINVILGFPPSVPGPLPLFGAGAAYGWSRRMRRHITAPRNTPPQA